MPGHLHEHLWRIGCAGIGKPGWPGTLRAYERGADRHQALERLANLAMAVSA